MYIYFRVTSSRGEKAMRKAAVNAVVDIVALIVFILSLVSGVILHVFLPSGGGGFRGGTGVVTTNVFLGVARSDWVDLHTYTSFIFTALVIVHLLLHWRYIKSVGRILRRAKTEPSDTG
jgi:hypothetical protein